MNVVQGRIKPIRDNVLITDMEFGEEKSKGGIIIQSLNGKSEGIKPRWGRVWAVGPEQKDVKVGSWILLEHGRWTRGVTVKDEHGDELIIRRADIKAMLAVSDEKPDDFQFGENETARHGSTHNPQDFLNLK
jgi:co-chaperonin GroES (HSP10)